MSEDEWETWIFSDEFPYSLRKKANVRVRRQASEYLVPECTTNQSKWDPKEMGWCAFCVVGVSDLVWIKGNMDSALYIDVLKEGLLPMYERLNLEKSAWTFQEDGDPKHQSIMTKAWKVKTALKFLTNWFPNSPDLNPIENLWAIIKRRVAKRDPKYLEEGKRFLYEEWKILETTDILVKLIHSMPKRVNKILKAKGAYINY